jgi:hypothetical protein
MDGNGIYRWRGKIMVPEDEALRTRIIHTHHDIPSAGHRGITKTLELVQRLFWWPSLNRMLRNMYQHVMHVKG